jgi:hypothetical protein
LPEVVGQLNSTLGIMLKRSSSAVASQVMAHAISMGGRLRVIMD